MSGRGEFGSLGRAAVVLAAASVGALVLAPAAGRAEPLLPGAAAMIEAAASGDAATFKAVVDLAKKTNPASVAEIDAQVAALAAKTEKARTDKLARASRLVKVKGEGQIGLSNTTGASNTIGVAASMKLSIETPHWRNAFAVSAEYERENGVTSNDQFVVGYEGNYRFARRFYAVGTVSWERDPSFGYDGRETASLGLGWKVLDSRKLSLALETGPAVRDTSYVAVPEAPAYSQTDAAARLSAAFAWQIWTKTVFTEDGAGFLQSSGGNNVRFTTAVTTSLFGALKARLSYVAQFESYTPPGIKTLDTATRLSLVYGF